jgi:hypothetical protein
MEYEDIQILECNNLSSIQYQSGNQDTNSLFTCKMGDNIQLKRGDKVNLEYCYINEKGCGLPSAIEIVGDYIRDGKGNIVNKTYKGISVVEPVGLLTIQQQISLTTHPYETITPTDITKELRSDTMYIPINYYTCLNCENTLVVPRRYAHENQTFTSTTDPATKPYSSIINESYKVWTTEDTIATGKSYYPIGSNQDVTGAVDNFSICDADHQLYFGGNDTEVGNTGRYHYPGVKGYWKVRQDGSRMTLMARESTIFSGITYDGVNYTTMFTQLSGEIFSFNYHIYTELMEIKLNGGYNTTDFIATSITQQLQEVETTELHYVMDGSGANATPQEHPFTRTTNTKTLKAFNSAWTGGMRSTNYTHYLGGGEVDEGIKYYQSHEYIGVKRPEIFVAGRKCNTWNATDLMIQNTIVGNAVNPNTTDHIITSYEWTEVNLVNLSNLFIEQGKYPELFDVKNHQYFGNGEDKNVNTCRFLHINRYNNITGDIGNRLGSDNRVDKGKNLSSMPIFFKYDKKFEGINTNGTTTTELSYGYATKTEVNGTYYITLHPELVGGLPSYIFKYQPANTITLNTTQIGWDWNWNSYSSVVCLLWSGYMKMMGDGISSVAVENYEYVGSQYPPNNHQFISEIMSKVYVGSDNSAVIVNDNHFGFEYLHMTENVGQSENAGETSDIDGTSNLNPIITDAGDEVYKINKRLHSWNWCADARPYDVSVQTYDVEVTPQFTMEPQYSESDKVVSLKSIETQVIKPLNRNITPFSVMDAHGGITMLLGDSYDKDNWKQGLLGVLGFTWEQFNPSTIDATNNRTARVDYRNINNLKYVTTNSQIVNTDIKNYVMNRYGGVMYTPQVPSPISLLGWGQDGVPGPLYQYSRVYEIMPIIVEQTESITISGLDVARSMIRPYYTIRSDLILQENNKYIGGMNGGDRLPVIAVINKENGDGDYYFSSESPLTFTITQNINLTSITTSIHDPNQSLSKLGEGSGVVYKITRVKQLDNGIINEILNPKKK